jgi:hypothetical protein
MLRRVVLISPNYEMCLPSQSTVPLATDCWLSKRPIVSKEVRPMPDAPYRRAPMAQFAQPRFLSENAMSYGHWFSTSHCSTRWRPADRGEIVALARPCEFSRCQTTFSKAIESETWSCSRLATGRSPSPKTARRSSSALAGVAS